jgi:hypothetical protein
MATYWPALLEQYERLRESQDKLQSQKLRAAIKEELRRPLSTSDVLWFAAALADEDRKYFGTHFVTFALKQGPNTAAVPLLDPLLRAAVYETNPSYNRWFVEPCVRCVGLAEDDSGSPRFPRLGKRLREGWRGQRFVLVGRVLSPRVHGDPGCGRGSSRVGGRDAR